MPPPPPAPRPLVLAHRGAWGPEPQNSLAAFERAVALGCDGVELDVRRTGDGRCVVVHDARVAGRLVARTPHERLRARLQIGQAPLLEEALEVLAGRATVDIELKEDGYVTEVMALVTRHLSPERYVVTSFRDAILPQVRRAVPGARTGLLVGPRLRLRELDHRLRVTGAGFVAPHVSLTRRVLPWAAERNIPAWLWTANDPRLLRRAAHDPRVAAVITDVPERALGIFTSP